jgi:spermidine synthase
VFSFPWWLSFSIGFLSLSEEIIWVRVIGFRYQSLPPAFSFVLLCFLGGIALGAAFGKRLCAHVKDLYFAGALLLSASALTDVLSPWCIGNLISPDESNLIAPALVMAFTAALKSSLFPVVHHLGACAQQPLVGRSVSRIYFGNILGATLGPIVTGFLAFDYLSVDECFGVVAACCLLASMFCALKSMKRQIILVTLATSAISSAIAYRMILPGPGSLASFAAGGVQSMSHFIANRHGVIHTATTSQGDLVFGGNVYDGIATVNGDTNPNGLERLYMLALLDPEPKQVLFVGLSAGAWVRAMLGFPSVERIDVIELNPGYLELTRAYPQLSLVLKDPRVHIHFDDGRRWLRRNPNSRFDFFVQNTTYYWRAYSGNLLSREYLSEVKRHLNPGGIAILNSTGSFDVLATVRTVFDRAYRYRNFAYASDHDLVPDMARLSKIRRPNGTPFLIADAPPTGVAAMLATARLEPVEEFLARRTNHAEIITDDNLLTEYRHGRRFGPEFLRDLLPPETPHFEFGDP